MPVDQANSNKTSAEEGMSFAPLPKVSNVNTLIDFYCSERAVKCICDGSK